MNPQQLGSWHLNMLGNQISGDQMVTVVWKTVIQIEKQTNIEENVEEWQRKGKCE